MPASAQTTPGAQVAFLDEFMTRLRAIPGVASVGGSTRIPLGSTQVTTMLAVEGRAVPDGKLPEVDMRRAVGDYFTAMGMPVMSGRVFQPEDRTASSGLTVVNSTLAARVFPGESVVGRRVRMGPSSSAPLADDHRSGRRHPAQQSGGRATAGDLHFIHARAADLAVHGDQGDEQPGRPCTCSSRYRQGTGRGSAVQRQHDGAPAIRVDGITPLHGAPRGDLRNARPPARRGRRLWCHGACRGGAYRRSWSACRTWRDAFQDLVDDGGPRRPARS